jgi:hypothetical protein
VARLTSHCTTQGEAVSLCRSHHRSLNALEHWILLWRRSELGLGCGVGGGGCDTARDEGIFQFAVNFRPRELESRPPDVKGVQRGGESDA